MRREFGVLSAFVWTFGATLALILAFQILEVALPGASNDLVTLGGIEALVYGTTTFLVWQVYAERRSVPEFLGVRRTHPAFAILGLGLGVALQAPADTLQLVVEMIAGPPSEADVLRRALMMRAESEIETAMMMFSAACLVPLVEELLFRGAIFGALKRQLSSLGAALVSGVGFVICHVDPRVWLPLAVVAVVLSLLRAVSGSVLPGFAVHLSFNAVSVAVIVLGIVPVDRRLNLHWSTAIAGWLASAALIYAMLRVARSPEAEQARGEDDTA